MEGVSQPQQCVTAATTAAIPYLYARAVEWLSSDRYACTLMLAFSHASSQMQFWKYFQDRAKGFHVEILSDFHTHKKTMVLSKYCLL